MSKLLQRLVDLTPKYATLAYRFGMEKGRPALVKIWNYSKVELRPPKLNELTPALEEGRSIVNFLKSGAWRQKSVKEAALDGVVALEVLMWFFVGEIIGRRSLIGYKHVKGAYIVAH
uniref:ATP synthase subunit n=1 Tax=Mesocestoides corti TaxID=53468 RepID=A0A5K3FYQ4_MESCO